MSHRVFYPLFLVFVLTGCSGSLSTPFVPPPADVLQTPPDESESLLQPQPTAELPPAPTATPDCINSLTYSSDLTVPDGSIVPPGSRLDKRWIVYNSGTCNWDRRYRIRLASGPDLGAHELALFPARGGTELIIQIIFTAPSEPGAYHSVWQAHDPLGNPFGDPFYIDIVVENP